MIQKHIKLLDSGSNYIQVIRVIREITGLGLIEARSIVDNCPSDLYATEQQINNLKSAGATVAEVPTTPSGYAPSTTRTVTTSSNYSTKTVNSTNSTASSIPQRSFNTQQSPATKRSLPPNTYLGMSGKQYQLSSKLGSGGEGDIYSVSGDSSKVAKLYHTDRVSRELEEKLRYMVNKPPRTEVLSQVAWPMDVLYDGSNKFMGFVMPKLTIDADLGEIYVYPPKGAAVMPYNYKLIIAMNICSVIYAVHQAGYIFGDFNPKNIGINLKTGAVAFMDTDSYHIVLDEKANKAYRCKVCLNGYVAPELQKQCEPYGQDAYEKAPLPTFTYETDNFALAIHIFKLLMNGYTPFNGIHETETVSTASPGVGNLAIKRDNYCFKPHNKPQAVAVPPLDALPDDIATLFNKAFIDGRKNPKERPNALAWRKALENYERVLKKCSNNPNHLFKNSLRTCPWCEADERYKQQFQRTSAPSQRAFPAPVSVPTAQPVQLPNLPSAQNGQPKANSSAINNSLQTTAVSTSYHPFNNFLQKISKKTKRRISIATISTIVAIIVILIAGITISNNLKLQNEYDSAISFAEKGDYKQAIDMFSQLGNYKDSEELLVETTNKLKEKEYNQAKALIASGEYESAITILNSLDGYKDSSALNQEAVNLNNKNLYSGAEELLQSGKEYEAALAFYELGDYQDSWQRSLSCWRKITKQTTVSAGGLHAAGFTVGVKKSGKCVAVGNNKHGQCDVDNWNNIISVAAGMYHSVGLHSDGTVVAVGSNEENECAVSNWQGIVAVSAYYHTVGLRADGTVVATGNNNSGECNVSGWRNIIAIAAGPSRTLGLRSDGTVVVTGKGEFGSDKVSDWKNVVRIATDMSHSFGVTSDGFVLGAGENYHNGWNQWDDIVDIAHGCLETVGLKSDGTTVSTNKRFSGWKDVVMLDGRSYHVVALKNDGTVYAFGNTESGQCDVDDWEDIMISN